MLFLTTNRGEAIDTAFQSRIHLTLQYPELSFDARYHIWEQFLARTPSNAVSGDEISKLAELQLNGRQIKNTVKTALLLARSRGSSPVLVKHIDTVLGVTYTVSAPKSEHDTAEENSTVSSQGSHWDDI